MKSELKTNTTPIKTKKIIIFIMTIIMFLIAGTWVCTIIALSASSSQTSLANNVVKVANYIFVGLTVIELILGVFLFINKGLSENTTKRWVFIALFLVLSFVVIEVIALIIGFVYFLTSTIANGIIFNLSSNNNLAPIVVYFVAHIIVTIIIILQGYVVFRYFQSEKEVAAI